MCMCARVHVERTFVRVGDSVQVYVSVHLYQTALCHNIEDKNRHGYCCENYVFHLVSTVNSMK